MRRLENRLNLEVPTVGVLDRLETLEDDPAELLAGDLSVAGGLDPALQEVVSRPLSLEGAPATIRGARTLDLLEMQLRSYSSEHQVNGALHAVSTPTSGDCAIPNHPIADRVAGVGIALAFGADFGIGILSIAFMLS